MIGSIIKIENKIEVCWLLSFYGALMTNRQREALQLYFEEDLSLGEIAQTSGVSRQCVHNTLQRATKQLTGLERKLGLVAKFRQMHSTLVVCRQDLDFVVASVDTQRYLFKVKQDLEAMIAKEEN